MNFAELLLGNLITPPILFFALGLLAGAIRSDLSVPESISRYLSLYLMMAIGFKGGTAIAQTDVITDGVLATAVTGMAIGFLQPFLGFALLRLTTRVDRATAAAISAHYGSISMVTFATAAAFLDAHAIIYAGYIVAVLALMEAPAIISGLMLAKGKDNKKTDGGVQSAHLLRDVFTNGSILLLTGAFVIGAVTGDKGMNSLAAFLIDPFQGILCLFLLDMGLLVARNLGQVSHFSWQLILFGLYMPLIGAVAGTAAAAALSLDLGTAFLFITLCASASYIAVPAAMRYALPQANAAIYVPMSLAVTFPFNITLGLPLYFYAAEFLQR